MHPYCDVCDRDYRAWLAEMSEVEGLALADPERDPRHRYATHDEAREHLDETAPLELEAMHVGQDLD